MKQYIRRNRRLFLLLAALALLFLVISANITRHAVPGRISFPASAVFWVVSPLQRGVATVAGAIELLWHRHLHTVNRALRTELLEERVAHLEAKLAEVREQAAASERLAEMLGFTIANPYRVLVARVIGFDRGGFNRVLTLDRGAAHGVGLDMPVVIGRGVVGRVVRLHPAYCQALLLTDFNSAVDALVQRTRDKGVVVGLGGGECEMKYVDRQADVQAGDLVVTSGMGGIFPAGLVVGEVREVQKEGPGLFQTVRVLPAVRAEGLEEVLVVLGGTR